jgi:hypothetical protein
MKAHLLFEARDFDFDAALPPNHEDLVKDLELSTLLEAMAQGDRYLHSVATRVVLCSLDDVEAIRYRQRVLADCLEHPEVIRSMYEIAVGALEDRRTVWGGYGGSYQTPSSNLAGAVHHLEAYVARLKQLKDIAEEHVGSFRSVGMLTLLGTLQRQLDDEYFETVSDHLERLRFRDGVLLSMELDRDNSGINYVLRSSGRSKRGWRGRLGLGHRGALSFTVAPRDEAGARALSEMTSRGINLVANAAAQSADHILGYFTVLRAELGFYVGCLNLADQLVARDENVSFPEPRRWDDGAFSCLNLRDASLALRAEEPVVGNDVDTGGRPLVIITGANSGGKSTFLRSVGLSQLMAQCGLFVTADALRVSVCQAVFTHFIREEDATMSSGRLDEELSRMSGIADVLRPRSLMLFNESFAATNEREGAEIGRQVVRALLDSDIRVCFVSHQYDFAESFHHDRPGSALFLRAPRSEDGRRSFKLEVAGPLPTSFGEDVYRRLGGWLADDGLDDGLGLIVAVGRRRSPLGELSSMSSDET